MWTFAISVRMMIGRFILWTQPNCCNIPTFPVCTHRAPTYVLNKTSVLWHFVLYLMYYCSEWVETRVSVESLHVCKCIANFVSVLRIRIQSDPYIIGSPGSGSVYYFIIYGSRSSNFKTNHKFNNLEYFMNYFQICLKLFPIFSSL